jgi:hypothetical protein
MKHRFRVIEEQDVPVAIAVGAYLDCEHYPFLHGEIMADLAVEKVGNRKLVWKQTLKWIGLRMRQSFTMEYFPPGHFKSYDMRGEPAWVPSIHQFVNAVVDVRFTPHPERDTTLMQFDAEIDLPFWLWPFRKLLQRALENMHHLKDQQDLEMIARRAAIFGRRNNQIYLSPGQFMIFKDDYVAHFGPECEILSSPSSTDGGIPHIAQF